MGKVGTLAGTFREMTPNSPPDQRRTRSILAINCRQPIKTLKLCRIVAYLIFDALSQECSYDFEAGAPNAVTL